MQQSWVVRLLRRAYPLISTVRRRPKLRQANALVITILVVAAFSASGESCDAITPFGITFTFIPVARQV